MTPYNLKDFNVPKTIYTAFGSLNAPKILFFQENCSFGSFAFKKSLLSSNLKDCAGWHSDDENLFGAVEKPTTIVSVSFGSRRVFEIKSKYTEDAESFYLDHGSVLTMDEYFQKHIKHRLVKDLGAEGVRYNLTFRYIQNHEDYCHSS